MLSNNPVHLFALNELPKQWHELKQKVNQSRDPKMWEKLVKSYITEVTPQIAEEQTLYEDERDQALIESYTKIFEEFWTSGLEKINSQPSPELKLMVAAQLGYDVYLKNMLEALPIVEQQKLIAAQSYGLTALYFAVNHANSSAVKVLLDEKYQIDVNQYFNGETLLHLATRKRSPEIVALLLARGANDKLKNTRSEMPIHVAALNNGPAKVVKILLEHDPENKNVTGGKEEYTALFRAVVSNGYEAAKALLEMGDDVNKVDPKSRHTALHKAAINNNPQLISLLVRSGAKIDFGSEDNERALISPITCALAQRSQSFEAVEKLISLGANVNAGRPAPLYAAVQNMQENSSNGLKLVKLLVENGAKINHPDNNGVSVLNLLAELEKINQLKGVLIDVSNYLKQASKKEQVPQKKSGVRFDR